MKKRLAELILGTIVLGLMGNAWSMYNDLKELKVKEPITKEDLNELKQDMKDARKEIGDLKVLIIQTRYAPSTR